jgi:hypothetical protein
VHQACAELLFAGRLFHHPADKDSGRLEIVCPIDTNNVYHIKLKNIYNNTIGCPRPPICKKRTTCARLTVLHTYVVRFE